MEDSVIFYLLDSEDDWESWSEHLREEFAIQTLQEWVCSDKFKVKASFTEIESETTLGKRLNQFRSEDQFWKDENYQRLKSLLGEVYEYWESKRWTCVETKKNGRPRTAEYSPAVLSKAAKYANVPFIVEEGEEQVLFRSVKWGRSVLGEASVKKWIWLVVLKENVFKHIYNRCGIEFFSGYTKDEIAEKLSLPKRFVNEMCRWLVDSGNWKIVQAKRNGSRRRELRFSVI